MINAEVESSVRDALDAAVHRDLVALEQMLNDLARHPQVDSMDLISAIGTAALHFIQQSKLPTDEDIRDLANEFRQMETWVPGADLPVEQVLWLFAGVEPSEPLDPGQATFTAVLLDAWMLSAFSNGNKEWYEQLDELLVHIESAP